MHKTIFTLLVCSLASYIARATSHCEDSIVPAIKDQISQTFPANSVKKEKKGLGGFLRRFIQEFDNYDTTYIAPNYYNYAVMLQNTNAFESYKISGTDELGNTQSITLAPDISLKLGPYFGWRWIFLGYTFDIGNIVSKQKTELNLSLYSSMLGCDLVYKKNKGGFKIRRITGFGDELENKINGMEFNDINTYIASANVYYIFNHKHFSYPAAYSQSTVQRKSCGSWKIGFTFTHQEVDFNFQKLEEILEKNHLKTGILNDQLKIKTINYYDYSLSLGYTYNWVFTKNCLFNISFAPAIGYKHTKGEIVSGENFIYNIKNLNIDFIARAGIVWNNSKWFGGASVIVHAYDYKKEQFSVRNTFGFLNIYFGMNFNKRKQYRNKK